MKLKDYIAAVLGKVIKFEGKGPIQVSLDIYIKPHFNYETKEWDILVVVESESASRLKFDIEV